MQMRITMPNPYACLSYLSLPGGAVEPQMKESGIWSVAMNMSGVGDKIKGYIMINNSGKSELIA